MSRVLAQMYVLDLIVHFLGKFCGEFILLVTIQQNKRKHNDPLNILLSKYPPSDSISTTVQGIEFSAYLVG